MTDTPDIIPANRVIFYCPVCGWAADATAAITQPIACPNDGGDLSNVRFNDHSHAQADHVLMFDIGKKVDDVKPYEEKADASPPAAA